MAKMVIAGEQRNVLHQYLEENSAVELVTAYLFFIENKLKLKPVLFVRDKVIYKSADEVVKALEKTMRVSRWRPPPYKSAQYSCPASQRHMVVYWQRLLVNREPWISQKNSARYINSLL